MIQLGTPIAPRNRSGPYMATLADSHSAGHGRSGVNEGTITHLGPAALELTKAHEELSYNWILRVHIIYAGSKLIQPPQP